MELRQGLDPSLGLLSLEEETPGKVYHRLTEMKVSIHNICKNNTMCSWITFQVDATTKLI